MIRLLKGLWYRRCRAIDLAILWPACLEHAETLDHAKAAFAVHALNDEAWLFLGQDEALKIIEALQP